MQPQDSIGFWLSYALRSLTSALSTLIRAHCEERGKPYVLTPQQFGIMRLLYGEESVKTMTALGRLLGVEMPAVTGIVTRLEQIGLVERVHDYEDRRVVKVSLTAEGQDIIRSLNPVVEAFQERLLPRDQQHALIHHLHGLITAATPAGEEVLTFAANDLHHPKSDPQNE